MFHRAVLLPLLAAVTLSFAAPAGAQQKAASVDAASLVGTWTGTATVPLGDSTIVVPVSYTFTKTGTAVGGMAMVPGQGQGTIANVVRDAARVRFRVTVKDNEGLDRHLEHDGTVGAEGAIEGMVNFDSKPVAKFSIKPVKTAPSK